VIFFFFFELWLLCEVTLGMIKFKDSDLNFFFGELYYETLVESKLMNAGT
jgi:hypothetical protein